MAACDFGAVRSNSITALGTSPVRDNRMARNFNVGDVELTTAIRSSDHEIFSEDLEMLESQQLTQVFDSLAPP